MPTNTQNNKQKDIILFKSVSTIEKYNFFEYLSVMVDSWVTISDALDSVLARIKNPFFIEKITELKTYVSSWDSFSKSMRKVPQIFNIGEVSIIEAWEATGMLVEALQKLSDDLKRTFELKKKVKGSLTYPIIIFLFLILAVVIVLTYVIPSLTPLFETAEVDLPWATVALVATSDFLRENYWYIIFVIFAGIVALVWYRSTPEWKNKINNILLGTPLIGPVFQNYVLSNVSASIWTLIGSWVNIVWEKTARIEEISKKINAQYSREVDYSLANLTKWIEPIAILLAGTFVLWFAFAIFGAILKVTQTVN